MHKASLVGQEQTRFQGTFDLMEFFQHDAAVIGIYIHDHITHCLVGLQVLGTDIDTQI